MNNALWARLGRRAFSLYARYLENVRWNEFAVAVGAAFTTGTGLGIELGLGAERAQWFGYVMAVAVAVAFLRNPKRRDWAVQTDEATPDA